MKNRVLLLLVCFTSLQVVLHQPCTAREHDSSLQQGNPVFTSAVPHLQITTTMDIPYRRNFDWGYVIAEVNDTIIFSITVTSGSRFFCNNALKRIEQNDNHYIITPESAREDEIHVEWTNLDGCGIIDARQTATGTMSVFPLSFDITEPFRMYYVTGIHDEDYFDITPGIPPTTTSRASTTSSTTITTPVNTTTALPVPLCLAEKIYGEYVEETELLRRVRDELLSKTDEGQEIIRLYYQWDALLAQALANNEAFTEEIKGLIDETLPVFEEMIE